MRKALSWVFLVAGALALIAALLVFVMDLTATDPNRYMAIHRTIETDSGLSQDGIERADMAFAEFLKGQGTLDYEDDVYGVKTSVFSDREIEHMADVYELFGKARRLGDLAAVLGAALIAAGVLSRPQGALSRLFTAANVAVFAVILGFAALTVAILRDFTGAFIAMHGLLFDNELWLMNPETDLMIRLLPEEFFSMMAIEIAKSAVWAIVAVAAASTVGIITVKRLEK